MVATLLVVAVVAFIAIQALVTRPADRRALAQAHAWAQREGYRIITCERLCLGGSFLLEASRYQRVFKVTLVRPDAQQAIADVRVGVFWSGMRGPTREPDVRWRDQFGYPAM